MVGLSPEEGETVRAEQVLNAVTTDRGTDMELILITAPVPPFLNTQTAAGLTEVTGNGYARITLSDGSWVAQGGGVWEYPEQIFTPAGGPWTNVRGYAIVSNGVTERLMAIEDDPNQPITVPDGQQYRVTPRITLS